MALAWRLASHLLFATVKTPALVTTKHPSMLLSPHKLSKNLKISLSDIMPSTRLLPASTMNTRRTPTNKIQRKVKALFFTRQQQPTCPSGLTRIRQSLHHFQQRIRPEAHLAPLPVEKTKRCIGILSKLQSLKFTKKHVQAQTKTYA
jgi:hypothetical protein